MSDRLYDSALVTGAAKPASILYENAEAAQRRAERSRWVCPVCDLPLGPISPRGRLPRYHYACGLFARFLSAAVRALEGLTSQAQRAGARRLLFAAANGLPVKWERERGADGRFVAAPPEGKP